ncbi:hypothetical protein [Eel River basin pequenovirus]|nr:hypothetical protein [Eel River basin pequenovirus]
MKNDIHQSRFGEFKAPETHVELLHQRRQQQAHIELHKQLGKRLRRLESVSVFLSAILVLLTVWNGLVALVLFVGLSF